MIDINSLSHFFQNDSSLKEGAELVFAVGFVCDFAGRCGHRLLQDFIKIHGFACRGGSLCPPDSFTVILRRGQAPALPVKIDFGVMFSGDS